MRLYLWNALQAWQLIINLFLSKVKEKGTNWFNIIVDYTMRSLVHWLLMLSNIFTLIPVYLYQPQWINFQALIKSYNTVVTNLLQTVLSSVGVNNILFEEWYQSTGMEITVIITANSKIRIDLRSTGDLQLLLNCTRIYDNWMRAQNLIVSKILFIHIIPIFLFSVFDPLMLCTYCSLRKGNLSTLRTIVVVLSWPTRRYSNAASESNVSCYNFPLRLPISSPCWSVASSALIYWQHFIS